MKYELFLSHDGDNYVAVIWKDKNYYQKIATKKNTETKNEFKTRAVNLFNEICDGFEYSDILLATREVV